MFIFIVCLQIITKPFDFYISNEHEFQMAAHILAANRPQWRREIIFIKNCAHFSQFLSSDTGGVGHKKHQADG